MAKPAPHSPAKPVPGSGADATGEPRLSKLELARQRVAARRAQRDAASPATTPANSSATGTAAASTPRKMSIKQPARPGAQRLNIQAGHGKTGPADANTAAKPTRKPATPNQAGTRPAAQMRLNRPGTPPPGAATANAGARPAPPSPAAPAGARGANPMTRIDPVERMLRVAQSGLRTPRIREAGANLVNRIAEIVPTDRAVLVELGRRARLINVSGGGVIEQDSRFADAVVLLNRRLRHEGRGVVVPPEPDEGGDKQLRNIQTAMRGTQILWLPLPFEMDAPGSEIRYALWLERWQGRPWKPEEVALLDEAALLFAQTLRPRGMRLARRLSARSIVVVIAAVLIGVLMIPIESSTIAPARIVPAHPTYVFAPLEGVLKELEITPGQHVEAGDVLFRYDAQVLDKQLDEATRSVAVAHAELERLEGAAFRDGDARAKLPVQQLEVELAESNVEFLRSQRERADVRAPAAGVIVLDDPDALIGRPLQLGEQVLGIADPQDTKIRMMVAASDAGLLSDGQRVELRLDRNPLESLPARVSRIGFEITLSETDIPSVKTDAIWDGPPPSGTQPGQRGSAKVISEPRPLWQQIFRKPLIKLREITGL